MSLARLATRACSSPRRESLGTCRVAVPVVVVVLVVCNFERFVAFVAFVVCDFERFVVFVVFVVLVVLERVVMDAPSGLRVGRSCAPAGGEELEPVRNTL